MTHLYKYITYVNENQSITTLSVDGLQKLLNDKNNENIIYDLIKLAQGFLTDIDGVKYKLEDVDFKTIRGLIRKSPLNDDYSTMYSMFISTHPKMS